MSGLARTHRWATGDHGIRRRTLPPAPARWHSANPKWRSARTTGLLPSYVATTPSRASTPAGGTYARRHSHTRTLYCTSASPKHRHPGWNARPLAHLPSPLAAVAAGTRTRRARTYLQSGSHARSDFVCGTSYYAPSRSYANAGGHKPGPGRPSMRLLRYRGRYRYRYAYWLVLVSRLCCHVSCRVVSCGRPSTSRSRRRRYIAVTLLRSCAPPTQLSAEPEPELESSNSGSKSGRTESRGRARRAAADPTQRPRGRSTELKLIRSLVRSRSVTRIPVAGGRWLSG
ncbi:hypothetical protein C8Q70DRAFT_146266 [Cubamyces menziesii]|nr:hypothetical protein C8Q70DRAFT_146266 [Cubamyces menziesii]